MVSSDLSADAESAKTSGRYEEEFPSAAESYRQVAAVQQAEPLVRKLFDAPAAVMTSKLTMLSGGPGRGGGITLSARKPQAAPVLTMKAISRISGRAASGASSSQPEKAVIDQGILLEIREMRIAHAAQLERICACLLYTSPSPRD